MIKRDYLKKPTTFRYKDAIKYMVMEDCRNANVHPCIIPNWDHSPRSGAKATILTGSTPELFGELIQHAMDTIKNKPAEEQLIFVKSWNEWAEGNYLEPDLEYGHAYLDTIKKKIEENK